MLAVRALTIFFAMSCGLVVTVHGSAAQPAPCKVAQLIAAEDRKNADEIDGGVGHHAMTIAIRNRSSAECVLEGQPALTFSGNTNQPFAVQFCPNCSDYLFDSQPVESILLKPKASAYVVLGYDINDGAGVCRNALTVGLRLPNEAAALKISVAQNGGAMRSCGRIDVTPFLGKPPVDGFLPRRDSAKT